MGSLLRRDHPGGGRPLADTTSPQIAGTDGCGTTDQARYYRMRAYINGTRVTPISNWQSVNPVGPPTLDSATFDGWDAGGGVTLTPI